MRSSNNRLNWLEEKTIAVIGGGISSEREISFKSAESVSQTLQKMGLNIIQLDPMNPEFFTTNYDIAFNCLHGKWGEDGGLQGYCELKKIPYTGPGIRATSIGLNKPLFKILMKELDIQVPKQYVGDLSFPLVIKPISEGSSIGISLVRSKQAFDDLVEANPQVLSGDYFFEEYISGQEITSGVITIDGEPVVLPILEIKTSNEFLDFDAKYTKGKETFILPANLSKEIQKEVQLISKKIYEFFDCKGCIRIDMIVDNGHPKILEMNTNPGLTNLSYIPMQAAEMGVSFEELMIHYLDSAK